MYKVIALFLIAISTAQAQTLTELMQATVARHPQLQSAQAAIEAAQKQQQVIEAQLNPQLSFSAQQDYAWMKTDFARSSLLLSADWTLWQPAVKAKSQATRAETRALQAQKRQVEQQLLWQLVRAWSAWQQLQVKLDAEQHKHQTLQHLLAQIQEGFATGGDSLAKLAIIRRRLAESQARQTRLKTQQQQQLAIVQALSGVNQLTPQAPPALPTPQKTAPHWPDTPWLQSFQWRITALQQKRQGSRAQYQGKLNLFAKGVRNDSGGRFYDDMQGVRIGVQYQVPLYSGGRIEAETDQLTAQLKGLRNQLHNRQLMLEQQWAQAKATLERAEAEEQALQKALHASQLDEQARLVLLRSGQTSILTVLESLLAQYNLERDLALNRWQAWQAAQQQRYLAGKLGK